MSKFQRYAPEFKAEAVKLVFEQGLSLAQAADKLGIPKGSLGNWIAMEKSKGKKVKPEGDATLEELKAEVVRLRRELAQAQMERDIVKKAAAYFAKDSMQSTRS